MSAPQSYAPEESASRRVATRVHSSIVERRWSADLAAAGAPKRWAATALRLVYVAVRELARGELTMRAMGLVYTTLLSLLPLFVVTFALIRAFGASDQVSPALIAFLSPLGSRGGELAATISDFVGAVDVGVVGLLGVLVLIYTVISLAHKVESALNFVWRVGRPRTLAARVVNHLSFLFLAPLLLVGGVLLDQELQGSLAGSLAWLSGWLIPYLMLAAAFAIIYYWLPNTRVKDSAAVLGGAVAALLWQLSGLVFATTIATSSRYAVVYAGLAAAILALIWLYVSWLIVLLGAQLAFLGQNPRYLTISPTRPELSNRLKERIALSVMLLTGANHYHHRRPWSLEEMVVELALPNAAVYYVVGFFERTGLLARTAEQPPRFIPARALETIEVRDLWKEVREAEETQFLNFDALPPIPAIDRFFGNAIVAAREALGATTLRDLVVAADTERAAR